MKLVPSGQSSSLPLFICDIIDQELIAEHGAVLLTSLFHSSIFSYNFFKDSLDTAI
jgi:hypothetical protein